MKGLGTALTVFALGVLAGMLDLAAVYVIFRYILAFEYTQALTMSLAALYAIKAGNTSLQHYKSLLEQRALVERLFKTPTAQEVFEDDDSGKINH